MEAVHRFPWPQKKPPVVQVALPAGCSLHGLHGASRGVWMRSSDKLRRLQVGSIWGLEHPC